MGGGTLGSAKGFRKIIHNIYSNFDRKGIEEITVEAGRPDTINTER